SPPAHLLFGGRSPNPAPANPRRVGAAPSSAELFSRLPCPRAPPRSQHSSPLVPHAHPPDPRQPPTPQPRPNFPFPLDQRPLGGGIAGEPPAQHAKVLGAAFLPALLQPIGVDEPDGVVGRPAADARQERLLLRGPRPLPQGADDGRAVPAVGIVPEKEDVPVVPPRHADGPLQGGDVPEGDVQHGLVHPRRGLPRGTGCRAPAGEEFEGALVVLREELAPNSLLCLRSQPHPSTSGGGMTYLT